jgi:hypothetical protein
MSPLYISWGKLNNVKRKFGEMQKRKNVIEVAENQSFSLF